MSLKSILLKKKDLHKQLQTSILRKKHFLYLFQSARLKKQSRNQMRDPSMALPLS